MTIEINRYATPNYITLMAYDGSNNVEYLGKAASGAASSSAVWQIKKFTYSGGNMTQILLADGNDAFDNTWDSRTGYSYS